MSTRSSATAASNEGDNKEKTTTTTTTSSTTTSSSNHKKRSAADAELLDFVQNSCSRRQLLSARLRQIQTYSSNPEAVQRRLDESCRRMFRTKVEEPVSLLDENVAKLTRQIQETGSLLDECRAYLQSQQFLLEEKLSSQEVANVSSPLEHKAEMETLFQECGTEIQSLEELLSSQTKTLESVKNDRQNISLESVRQNIWNQYMSQRDAMVHKSIAAVAAHELPQAQMDVAQHDSHVQTHVDQLLHPLQVDDDDQPGAAGKAAAIAASIQTSHVLHVCAAHGIPEYIDLMLGFLPNQDEKQQQQQRDALNLPDEDGTTPLMAAVGASSSLLSLNHDDGCSEEQEKMRYQMVKKLIQLGADKSRKDATGKTALKLFRDTKQRRWRGARMENAGGESAEGSLQPPQRKSSEQQASEEDILLEALLQPSDDSSNESSNKGNDKSDM